MHKNLLRIIYLNWETCFQIQKKENVFAKKKLLVPFIRKFVNLVLIFPDPQRTNKGE